MTTRTILATANVRWGLSTTETAAALDAVLDAGPDLVGLQEWYPPRAGLLRQHGRLAPVPWRGDRESGASPDGYRWHVPVLGGCVLGARSSRFVTKSCRPVVLSWPGRADRGERILDLEPPRLATVAVYRDLLVDRTVCLIGYHLVSGVQARDRYREDRPRLVARHRREVQVLRGIVRRMVGDGHDVYALGDSNFHVMGLPGLVSAWEGRDDEPGTLGPRRHVDDVHAPRPARSVSLIATASDHRAVVTAVDD